MCSDKEDKFPLGILDYLWAIATYDSFTHYQLAAAYAMMGDKVLAQDNMSKFLER